MKTKQSVFIILLGLILFLPFPGFAQKLKVDGEAAVGHAGEGQVLLTLTSERNWAFRQFNTGPSTALELADLTGLKNFILNTTGNVGIGLNFPMDKLHVNGNIRAVGTRISFGSNEYFEDGGSFIINCNGSLLSTFDGVDDLGSSAKRWRNVWATGGTINTSDGSLKSNIRDLPYGLKEILQLHPVSFVWKEGPERGVKLGLIAQEVQGVIREVVADHEFARQETTDTWKSIPATHLGLYYTDLIPVLIRGMQEQQQLLDAKEQRIAELEEKAALVAGLEQRLARLEQLMNEPPVVEATIQGSGSAYLQQNVPNPFRQLTHISYALPENTQDAFLRITDPSGKVLKTVKLESMGPGKIELSVLELPAGTYTYTLVADGNPLESRSMILIR